MSINETINAIRRNMDNPKELEKILLELSDEELGRVISALTDDEYNELKSKIKNEDLLQKIEDIRKSRSTKSIKRSSNRFNTEIQSPSHCLDKSDDNEPSP